MCRKAWNLRRHRDRIRWCTNRSWNIYKVKRNAILCQFDAAERKGVEWGTWCADWSAEIMAPPAHLTHQTIERHMTRQRTQSQDTPPSTAQLIRNSYPCAMPSAIVRLFGWPPEEENKQGARGARPARPRYEKWELGRLAGRTISRTSLNLIGKITSRYM